MNKYYKEFCKLKKTIPCWDNFFTVPEEERLENWPRLEVLGNAMCEKYAWAVPDDRALRILKHFSPLIEIGAGKGYFSHLLWNNGVDIVAFDREIDETWDKVSKGGPEQLHFPSISEGRNLFLCYPDEDTSMARPCLDNFRGDYIIHIGELISSGTLSSPQSPWGRTSSADFQEELMATFHCILIAEIPAFPFSRDCISVWKRTQYVQGKETIEKWIEMDAIDDYNSANGIEVGPEELKILEKEAEDVENEDCAWASIPVCERLPVDRAAPELQFLM